MLIGDPQQLSPTIPSDSLHPNGLDRTLFERLRDAGHATILLATQYRVYVFASHQSVFLVLIIAFSSSSSL